MIDKKIDDNVAKVSQPFLSTLTTFDGVDILREKAKAERTQPQQPDLGRTKHCVFSFTLFQ